MLHPPPLLHVSVLSEISDLGRKLYSVTQHHSQQLDKDFMHAV